MARLTTLVGRAMFFLTMEEGSMKKLAIVTIALALGGCLSYNKALRKCEAKCAPQRATSVAYNYSTNRYDVCICDMDLEGKVLTEEEVSN